MKKLKDKTIIVTGGSLGIGLSVSKKIASEGGTVILCARNETDLLRSKEELEKISNSKHYVYPMDVSKITHVESLFEWIKKRSGHINGLVNCAGVYGPIGKTYKVNMEELVKGININLIGTIYMCSVLHDLFSGVKKKIVNFSGGGAATPFPNYSTYAISKIGVVRFTENLALELKNENFEINCVAPGFVATRIHEDTIKAGSSLAGESFYENTKKQLEEGAVSPEIAADLTTFLLSDDSNGITGKFISAPWDPWRNEEFQELLKNDNDIATLRRIDNKTFFKK